MLLRQHLFLFVSFLLLLLSVLLLFHVQPFKKCTMLSLSIAYIVPTNSFRPPPVTYTQSHTVLFFIIRQLISYKGHKYPSFPTTVRYTRRENNDHTAIVSKSLPPRT
mmetsp:Transcript_20748/g.45045  ORF Transcript_20748/g.45045 Transcript_20748/m.45045 type:complete len:107 (-) Transcript_20748:1287-1607(-)